MSRTRITTAILVGAGLLVFAVNAYTVPRYSARYEQSCNLCHFNPTGGGERVPYASQYIVPKEMAWTTPGDEEMSRIDPRISKSVTIGADARTFFFRYSIDNAATLRRPATENFFEMQGNLYLAFQLTDRISAHMSKGLSTTSEIYGLGYILPGDGWIKVGRFSPPFGWRFADHTAFVRDLMGFFPPAHTDVGMEVGLSPGRLEVEGAVMNGQLGSTQDFNRDVGLSGRGEYRLDAGPVGLSIGGSVYRNTTAQGDLTAGGPLGYLHWGRLTWVWEFDLSSLTPPGGSAHKSWFSSHEVAVQAHRGLDLKGTFDIWDPDREANTGRQMRYGFGGELMPYPFVRLEAMAYLYRNQTGKEGMDITDPQYTEWVGQVHFFY